VSSARSARDRAEAKAARKALGLPVRGDAEAGRAKTPYAPRGGRNSRGRGAGGGRGGTRNKQGRLRKA
jgi:hypothetical protein